MSFLTPLRYPGGKGRLSQFMADLIQANGLEDGHYAEPYAGGAGIAITLLSLEYVQRVHLNDLNKSIFAFWSSVLNETEQLSKLIRETPVTMEEWRRQRAVQDDPSADQLSLGFSTFFLNRANRSGIIRGGVIGGKEQKGDWKIDARFKKDDLIKRIQKIASYGGRVKIYNLDAVDFVKTVIPTLPAKSLTYLDPPYFVKGKGLYEDHYSPEDHGTIAAVVQNEVTSPWLVSYDNAPEIKALYPDRRQHVFDLYYSAAKNRSFGKEVMIYSDSLIVPSLPTPSRAAAA